MTRRTCVDCSAVSPEVESQYTLIKDGWRVVKGQGTGGEWRCSVCWAQLKGRPSGAQRVASPSGSSSSPPPTSGAMRAARSISSDRPVSEMTSEAAPESPRRRRP